jgi:PIN domain nuclease of toxin-antitoxin system
VRLLLDTHILLWAMTKPKALSPHARRLLADHRNSLYFSAINLFEIASKRASGRRSAPHITADAIHRLALLAEIDELPLRAEHAIAVETLAISHPDPFDRLLLAQAESEGMQLLTRDENLARQDSASTILAV